MATTEDPKAVYATSAATDLAGCWCQHCRDVYANTLQGIDRPAFHGSRMVVCPDCGNKRCPKANFHGNTCTNSNERGQKGSSWGAVKPWPKSDTPAPAAPLVADNFVRLPDEQRAKIKQMAQAATPGPWHYRNHEFDDWGVVRGADRDGGPGYMLASVKSPHVAWEDMNAHRSAGTDPYGATAQYIAAVSPDVALGTLAYVEHLEAENTRLTARLAAEAQAAAEQVESGYHQDVIANSRMTELEERVAIRDKWLADAKQENTTLRAKLAQEGEQEKELLKRDEAEGLLRKALKEARELAYTDYGAAWRHVEAVAFPSDDSATLPAPTQEGRPERGEVAKPLTCQCSMSMVMRGKDGAGYCAACGLVVPEAGIDSPSEDDDEPI